MSNWTTPALDRLKSYLDSNGQKAAATGADADEVVADLRHHVEAEVAALKLPVVTEEDVQRIIARTGTLPQPEAIASDNSTTSRSIVQRVVKPVMSGALLFFGVLLPLATLCIELVTHMCAGTFFDPLPTWLHVLFVATVPAANAATWCVLRREQMKVPRWLRWLNGVAIGTGVFYAILYLPMTPFAALGIFFLGFGLLPLSPLLSLIATLRCSSHLRRRQVELSQPGMRGWWWSVGTPVLLLTLFALPGPLTRHWIDAAGSESPEESVRAIQRLRAFGSDEVILKECYGRSDRLGTEFFGARPANAALAQKVFYQVTGKAYNAVPPPLSKFQRSARDLFNDFEWDDGLGGETVAGQVKGLSLQQSRMDGVCEPDEGWAYLQWTMEFRNEHEFSQREARAQVQLPPGAVVSRVTLWINGEPREAAFAGRGEVREAYQKVAVQQRRDPVLVTTSGPDRVLVQCFPIQPKGGTMKIRLGITVPLLIESTNEAALRLPCFAERNFKMSSQFAHSFWLETPQQVRAEFAKLTVDTSKPGKSGVRGEIPERTLASAEAVLRFNYSQRLAAVRAVDVKAGRSRSVVQTLETQPAKMPAQLAIVLDGSEDMTSAFPQIGRALDGLPATELAIWLAQDETTQIFNTAWTSTTPSASVAKLRGVGGQDDLPALLQAWEWAAAKPGGLVLWLHGAQPLLVSGVEALRQRLDWREDAGAPRLLDFSITTGPNRIAEQIASSTALSSVPRTGDVAKDLERLFATFSGRQAVQIFKRVPDSLPINTNAPSASAHIVRLWAAEEVQSLRRARRNAEAVKLAAEQQLVTPVSGAVVLETKQQYEMTGLTPADPATVPLVPEPSTWAMILIGAFAMWALRRRTRHR